MMEFIQENWYALWSLPALCLAAAVVLTLIHFARRRRTTMPLYEIGADHQIRRATTHAMRAPDAAWRRKAPHHPLQ